MKAKTTGLKKIEYKIFKFPQKTILLSIESSRLYKIHTCLIPLFLNKNYFNSWKRIENYLKKLPLKNKTLISQEIKHFIQSENNCFNKKTLQKQSKKIHSYLY